MAAPGAGPGLRRWERRTGWLGVGLLLTTVVVAAAMRHLDGPIVVGSVVPRRWHAVGALFSAGLLALAAAGALRLSGEPDERAARRSGAGRWARRAAVGLLVLTAGGAFTTVAMLDAITTYHVLSPASTGGCRIVVGERSLLLLGSGTVYVLRPGGRLPQAVADYGADDGYRPVTFGTYHLSWRGETADLELSGTEHQPVSYEARPLSCG